MPSLTFVLPHWLYWAGLALFPLVAMAMVARARRHGVDNRPSLFIAYLFWLFSGFAGMHRFYLRSAWGFIFIPVFLVILYGNGQIRIAREEVSAARAASESVERQARRFRAQAERGVAEARERLTRTESELDAVRARFQSAQAGRSRWERITQGVALLLGAMLLIDAALLPRLVRRRREAEPAAADGLRPAPAVAVPAFDESPGQTRGRPLGSRVVAGIDSLSRVTGEFVAYWSVIAVFVYYYEVLGRYVLNSPTNWVHESTFLMFGMQYMLAGAYAYRDDSHVRVDILYSKLPRRAKALADVITSIFFFIFTITMFWTGLRFALDAINVGEHSFTEWGIQYWPVKLTIPIGAALIILQGVARLIKDLAVLTGEEA
jgi:TRAP-type mannitol/chloroaromatic compound transport system permease small subunit